MRITRPQMFMEIAKTAAKRSTCGRLNVGAVIVHGRDVVSIGYNGVPSKVAHCQENECPGRRHCREAIHAEVNAMNHVPDGYPFYDRLDLYVTHSPCKDCYRELCEWGMVGRVFFEVPYRETGHIDKRYEGEMHPLIYQLLPAGYIRNWKTQEWVNEVET